MQDTIPPHLTDRLIAHLETMATPERVERMDAVLEKRTRHITVVLENIFQPHNASAVVRSCECFGIQNLHIIENNYHFERTRTITMGADKWLTLKRYNEASFNTPTCFNALKEQGYKIAATTLRPDAIALHELPIDEPIALAFGTELTGLTEEAHALADHFVYLPMHGFTQSFNISVSCALALYDLRTRLNESSINWQLDPANKAQIKLAWLCASIRSSERVIEEWMAQNA